MEKNKSRYSVQIAGSVLSESIRTICGYKYISPNCLTDNFHGDCVVPSSLFLNLSQQSTL